MNKVLISALKPLGFLGAMTTMTITCFVNESYNEEQRIESVILRTNRADFIPLFSTVHHYIKLLQ